MSTADQSNEHQADEASKDSRRSRVTVRIPLLGFVTQERDSTGRKYTRFGLRAPFVSIEMEGENLLEAAGRRSERKRLDRSREALISLFGGLLGLVLSSVTALVGTGKVLDGAGLAVAGAVVATAVLATVVGVRTLVTSAHEGAPRIADDRVPTHNLDQLALELAAGRRAALNLRRQRVQHEPER